MARSKVFPLRLDDETRERWLKAADGGALAWFIKQAVEEKITRDSSPRRAFDSVDDLLADGLISPGTLARDTMTPSKQAALGEREPRGSATVVPADPERPSGVVRRSPTPSRSPSAASGKKSYKPDPKGGKK